MYYLAWACDILFLFVVAYCIAKAIKDNDYKDVLLYTALYISYIMLFFGLR